MSGGRITGRRRLLASSAARLAEAVQHVSRLSVCF
jgi:hypothetical protein